MFVPEWRAAIPPHRLLILRSEDYAARPVPTLQRVVRLLGLRRFAKDEAAAAAAVESTDELTRVVGKQGLPPRAEAAAVRRWYAPYNSALAAMLRDDAFLWPEHAMVEDAPPPGQAPGTRR